MEIKAEINKRNKKNNGKKSVKLKLGSLERPIARKTENKKKKRSKELPISVMRKGYIVISSTDSKIIIKEYSEQIYDKKFTNIVKLQYFLEWQKLPKSI